MLSEASSKRLSVSPSPSATEVSITSSAASPAASMITTSEAPTTSNNNNNLVEQPTSKRHSLLVTLDDGSTTQTIGSVTKLKDKEDSGGGGGCGTKSQGSPNLSIEEIGHDTLMREIQKTTGRSPSPQKEKAKTKQIFSKYLTIEKMQKQVIVKTFLLSIFRFELFPSNFQMGK